MATYDGYLRPLLTRGIKKASLKLRLAATVRIGFRLTIATYDRYLRPLLTIATYERYKEGVFEAKTCSDCENWVQTTEHGPKQNHLPGLGVHGHPSQMVTQR